MRVTIYQPRYFPQLHYFQRMLTVSTFALLDSAQYTKTLTHKQNSIQIRHKSYQSDTPIKTAHGIMLLTVPITHDGLLPINQTKIDYSHHWERKHLRSILVAYRKAKNFLPQYPKLQALLLNRYTSLAELNIQTIFWGLSSIFDWEYTPSMTLDLVNKRLEKQALFPLKRIVKSSDLSIPRPQGQGKGTEWTTAICKSLGATEYVHGETAKNSYMDLSYYRLHNITPITQNWICRKYPQLFSNNDFSSNLSIIDLVLLQDAKDTQQLLQN
ncbi:MAG TPA: WbqC family protein [Patescibacteria group bacterium]|nr:WbqC family protein [Patescibacteria group bacterium]